MSINYIFVGQQVFKQAHTHAKLYRTHTVLHLFRPIFFVHCTALTCQSCFVCVLCSRLLFPYMVSFMSLLDNSCPGVCDL